MVTYLDIETNALEADRGMVIAIGLLKDESPIVKTAVSQAEEQEILKWMNSEVKSETIMTWYGSNFDVPFLLAREAHLNIVPKALIESKKIDLLKTCREKLQLSTYRLKSVANFLGINTKDNYSGKDIPTLFKLLKNGKEEARELIIKHCESDLTLLKHIHEKIEPYIKNPKNK